MNNLVEIASQQMLRWMDKDIEFVGFVQIDGMECLQNNHNQHARVNKL